MPDFIDYYNPLPDPSGYNTYETEDGKKINGIAFKLRGKTYVSQDGTYHKVIPVRDPDNVALTNNEYKTAFDGDEAAKPLNFASFTLWAGGIARGGNIADIVNRVYEGNNGIVTDNFAQEHPYWALAANIGGDLATGLALTKGSLIARAVKNSEAIPEVIDRTRQAFTYPKDLGVMNAAEYSADHPYFGTLNFNAETSNVAGKNFGNRLGNGLFLIAYDSKNGNNVLKVQTHSSSPSKWLARKMGQAIERQQARSLYVERARYIGNVLDLFGNWHPVLRLTKLGSVPVESLNELYQQLFRNLESEGWTHEKNIANIMGKGDSFINDLHKGNFGLDAKGLPKFYDAEFSKTGWELFSNAAKKLQEKSNIIYKPSSISSELGVIKDGTMPHLGRPSPTFSSDKYDWIDLIHQPVYEVEPELQMMGETTVFRKGGVFGISNMGFKNNLNQIKKYNGK